MRLGKCFLDLKLIHFAFPLSLLIQANKLETDTERELAASTTTIRPPESSFVFSWWLHSGDVKAKIAAVSFV